MKRGNMLRTLMYYMVLGLGTSAFILAVLHDDMVLRNLNINQGLICLVLAYLVSGKEKQS